MKNLLLLLLTLFVVTIGTSQEHKLSKADSIAILQALEQQQSAWNKGNISAFMENYWKSENLVFNGSSGPIFGWENTKQRYLNSYPDLTTMGILTFEVIDLQSIASGVAQMIGTFHLKRSIGDLDGYFTLNWKKFDQNWLIISDHTSGSN